MQALSLAMERTLARRSSRRIQQSDAALAGAPRPPSQGFRAMNAACLRSIARTSTGPAGVRLDGYWIAICLRAAAAFFGSVSSSTPSRYFASTLASSSSCGSVKLRVALP